MADYGLIVKNSTAGIQIDSLYKNFSLFQTGSLALVDYGYPNYGENTIDFTDTAQIPIIGIRPSTTTFCALKRLNKSGANFVSATVEKERDFNGTIQWIVFIDGLLNALPVYGLIVRNSSNQVVFSSNEQYFKIKGVYPLTVTEGNYVNVTVVNADTNYFILYPFSFYIISNWIEEISAWSVEVRLMGIKKISSTIVRVEDYEVRTYGEAGDDATFNAWNSDCRLIEIGT